MSTMSRAKNLVQTSRISPEAAALLLAENSALRIRLEEAEETLRAIRHGEVDALVVNGPIGTQIYTLQGTDAESNQFRGEILSQISDAVVAVDNEERVTYLNTAAERQYGVTAGEALGRSLREVWIDHWHSREDEEAAMRALRETGYWRGETVHTKRTGEEIQVESAIICMHDANGARIGLLATIRDISERKRAEERLRRVAQEAEAASRAKDDFLAALSHELRTPLTPVLMSAAALETDPALPEEMREQLAMMRRNIQLEARLIDDLLDLTRITRGKLQVHPAIADVHELLRHTEEIIRSDAVHRKVVEFHFEANQHHVMADSTRLQQVFWNLIKNALKFSRADGRVIVRTFNPEPHRFAVSVVDSGIGIAPENIGRIFKAFDQGELQGRHQFGGLGLGLTISKAIVDLHGGSLLAASGGRGHGASFTVELDTVKPQSRTESTNHTSPWALSALRLLIVEDHEPTLGTMARLLERDGHCVFTAATIRDALAQADAHECDLVISDLGLPDGSGLDLMREIRSRRGWPGIALSGYGMEDDVRRALESGFGAHLVKPVDVTQLRQTIEMLLTATRAA
jgi:PAS domain S-box-containing protein